MNTIFTCNATVEVELTMEQLANIIVHLGSDQQARLISLMAEVDFSVPTQLQYVTDDEALTDGGRRLMELIGAYARPLPTPEPLGPAGKAHMELRALLTTEADRAERGEQSIGQEH